MNAALKPGTTAYATPTDTTVTITRVLAAPRTVVFDAWTNPKHIPNWLLGPEGWTMPVCELDARPGGKWRYVWRKTKGEEMTLQGVVREFTPPSRFETTESWGPEWPETINRVDFTEANGLTTVVLTVNYVSKEARDAALKTGMKDGIEQGFARLDRLLASLS